MAQNLAQMLPKIPKLTFDLPLRKWEERHFARYAVEPMLLLYTFMKVNILRSPSTHDVGHETALGSVIQRCGESIRLSCARPPYFKMMTSSRQILRISEQEDTILHAYLEVMEREVRIVSTRKG